MVKWASSSESEQFVRFGGATLALGAKLIPPTGPRELYRVHQCRPPGGRPRRGHVGPGEAAAAAAASLAERPAHRRAAVAGERVHIITIFPQDHVQPASAARPRESPQVLASRSPEWAAAELWLHQ